MLSLTFITCFNFTKSELIIGLWADPVALAFRSVAIVLLFLCFTGVAIWRNGVTRQNNELNALNTTIQD